MPLEIDLFLLYSLFLDFAYPRINAASIDFVWVFIENIIAKIDFTGIHFIYFTIFFVFRLINIVNSDINASTNAPGIEHENFEHSLWEGKLARTLRNFPNY